MRKMKNGLRLLLALVLTAGLLVIHASAAAPSVTQDVPNTCVAVVGQPIILTCAAEGEELFYQWYSTQGMLEGQTGSTLNITAAPEHDGIGLFCTLTNSEGTVNTSICTVTVVSVPVLTQDLPTNMTYTAGDTMTFTCAAEGKDLSYQWYSTSSVLVGQEGPTLTLTAEGDCNGLGYYCQIRNAAGSVSTQVCTVAVNTPTPTPAPAPIVTKDPTGETVTEGGSAIFIARADNTEEYLWRFISKDGTTTYDYTQIRSTFPSLSITGGDTEVLTLAGIPYELDGWQVACLFKGVSQDVLSAGALLTVKQAQIPAPTITRQPTGAEITIGENTGFTLNVTATSPDGGMLSYQWYNSLTNDQTSLTPIDGATSATYRPIQSSGISYYCVAVWNHQGGRESVPVYSTMVKVIFNPAEGPDAGVGHAHVHSYSMEWKGNDLSHWHECSCGAHQDEAFHSFDWTVTKEPTKKQEGQQTGVCSVCGYESTETIPAGLEMDQDGAGNGKVGLIVLFVVLILGVLATGGYLIWRILKQKNDYDDYGF